MTQLGGYFAVTYLAESIFQTALSAYWEEHYDKAGGRVSRSVQTPFGRADMEGAMWIERPRVTFSGGADALLVQLMGAARFSVALSDSAMGGVFVSFDTTVLLRPKIDHAKLEFAEGDVLQFGGFTFDASAIQLTWFDGPHHVGADEVVLSEEMRSALADEARLRARRFLSFELPTDELYMQEFAFMTAGVPGSIITTPHIRLGDIRILNGWLAVGFDATAVVFATHGNAATIGPPPDAPADLPGTLSQARPGGETVRLIVDGPGLQRYLAQNAKSAVAFAQISRPSLHPDAVTARLADDAIDIHVTGKHDAPDPFPGVEFTADVHVRPYVGNKFVYASVKPSVRIDVNWIEAVLIKLKEFFSGGDLFGRLARANQTELAVISATSLFKAQTVPGLNRFTISLELRRLNIRPADGYAGLFAALDFSPKPSEVDLSDVRPVPAFGFINIRGRFLDPVPGALRLRHDPTFLQRTRVTRGSNGTEVASATGWTAAGGILGTQVDLWAADNWLESFYTVETVVERPPGTVVGSSTTSIAVRDVFDRSKPFVRWRRTLAATNGMEPKPSWATVLSAVHRTALPGRCQYSDRRSHGYWPSMYEYQHLETLPDPADPDRRFSPRLCAYCFPERTPEP